MNIRNDSVYISRRNAKALGYLPKDENHKCIDAFADEIIGNWLERNHPEILTHLESVSETDDAFRKSIVVKPLF